MPNCSHSSLTVNGMPSPYLAKLLCDGSPCVPDCDANGTLNINDFVCFQTTFAIGDLAADCDGDGQLLIDDFLCFQTAFAIGC